MITLILIIKKYFFIALAAFLSLFYSLIVPFITQKITFIVQKIVRDISLLITSIVFNKNYTFFENQGIGALIRQVERGIIAYENLFKFIVNICLPNIISIFIIAVYLFFISNIYTVIFLFAWAILSIKLISYMVRLRKKHIQKVNDTEDSLSDSFAEVFLAGKTIKFFNILNTALKKLKESYDDYAKDTTKLSFFSTMLSSIQYLLSHFCGCIIMLIGVYLLNKNSLSVGEFVVIYNFSNIFMGGIIGLTEAHKNYQEFKVDKSKLDELCKETEYKGYHQKELSMIEPVKNYDLLIKPFDYQINQTKSIFSKKPIKIAHKNKIAIVGETGIGKSTLLKIMTGIIKTNNTVFIGDKEISKMDEGETALYLALYFQFPDFLSGNVERTIFLDSTEFEKEEVIKDLKSLRLENLTETLLNSDDINVNNFSGGEQKRLDILRSNYNKAPIIIFDEPTSSIDEETSKIVWDFIFNKNQDKTIICVTHDQSSIDKFDMVITIKDGEVIYNKS